MITTNKKPATGNLATKRVMKIIKNLDSFVKNSAAISARNQRISQKNKENY
jgi:hypothetical protein